MKSVRVLALVALALANFASTSKADRGGGGGGVPRSSPEQIRKAIERVHQTMDILPYYTASGVYQADLNREELQPFSKDKRTKEILEEMSGRLDRSGSKERAYEVAIMKSKFMPFYEGPCKGEFNEDKDASVPKLIYPTTICFSVPMLSRFPAEYLYQEILALAQHEIAHEMGYLEPDADRVQTFFRKAFSVLTLQNGLVNLLKSEIKSLPLHIKFAANNIFEPSWQKMSNSSPCLDIQVIRERINMITTVLGGKYQSGKLVNNQGEAQKLAAQMDSEVQMVIYKCDQKKAGGPELRGSLLSLSAEADLLLSITK